MKKNKSKLDIIDPEWINEIAMTFFKLNEKFSENQKKMIREYYLENLKKGSNPKESMNNALKRLLNSNNR